MIKNKRNTSYKHGMDGTPVYKAWISLKARCNNKKDKDYKDYGGRGIKVCDRWLHSFENFYKDIGDKPTSKHSIDRIDNNGNYCKENCRWATIYEQNNNRRSTRYIEYKGDKMSLFQWCRKLGMPQSTFSNRILRGWSIKNTIEIKVEKKYGHRK